MVLGFVITFRKPLLEPQSLVALGLSRFNRESDNTSWVRSVDVLGVYVAHINARIRTYTHEKALQQLWFSTFYHQTRGFESGVVRNFQNVATKLQCGKRPQFFILLSVHSRSIKPKSRFYR